MEAVAWKCMFHTRVQLLLQHLAWLCSAHPSQGVKNTRPQGGDNGRQMSQVEGRIIVSLIGSERQ